MKASSKIGMKRSRTPWAAKLRPQMIPQVVTDPKGRGQMLLPTPMLVAEEMATIPRGALLTVAGLRLRLARRFGADIACPLMTGIFCNIVAGATEDLLAEGKAALAPYWRVIFNDGTLSPKTPAGPEKQAERLREEGHEVIPRRAKLLVNDYQLHLAP